MVSRVRNVVPFLMLALLGAGCVAQEGTSLGASAPATLHRPVVIALIDSGIDPYHEAFAAAPGTGAEAWAEEFDATPVRLSPAGSYDERLAEDEGFWRDVELGRLYAFEGTRVMGISISHSITWPALRDSHGHGTLTASLAAREAPEALVVMIQTNPIICTLNRPHEQCPLVPNIAPALEWAARQPWIDVISMSIGYPGNPPPLVDHDRAVVEASRLAHESGKLVVVATGNTVAPPMAAPYAGPPWIVAVGGYVAPQGGEAVQAGKLPDVVANFSDRGAREGTLAEQVEATGTSLATPIVAGTLANALRLVHAERPEVSPIVLRHALREALNASARHGGPTEWRPTQPASNSTLDNVFAASAPVLVPALQQGWGYVHGGLAGEIARRVLEEDLSPPPEKALAAQHQAQYQAARERYWAVWG